MITVNGQPAAGEGLTVEELLARMEVPDRGVAVAVDAEVVPRGEWPTYVVPDGAHVEVVTAVQGG
ncbi:MAG TPA: sulfur carrier protein ThiS [Solirubrobacteraceae bacterium]|nr:sulfur carrier protein ThiS [Solirubrobacteraceae bacterium]